MKQDIYIIEENVVLAKNTMKMVISGDTDSIKKPGQFVNIKIEGLFLRRPISICDVEDGKITLIYKIVGQGTEALASMEKGNRLDVLVGLGDTQVVVGVVVAVKLEGHGAAAAGESPGADDQTAVDYDLHLHIFRVGGVVDLGGDGYALILLI